MNFEKFDLDALERAHQTCVECGLTETARNIRAAIDAFFESEYWLAKKAKFSKED